MKKQVERKKFTHNDIYLPVTMKQFEELTNELLAAINTITGEEDQGFEADYFAQVLMSAIHAMKHEDGRTTKLALFEGCVNRISCHVTYHMVQEIQRKIEAKKIEQKIADGTLEGLIPLTEDADQAEATH
jgi:hypothetical protein